LQNQCGTIRRMLISSINTVKKTDTNSITAVRTAAETFLLKTLFKTFRKETLLFLNSK
jgi:hypothetical protein